MAKRLALLGVAVAALMLFPAAKDLSGKAHVPLGRAQICTANGDVRAVQERRLGDKIAKGACRLTACVFNDIDDEGDLVQQFIFLPGDPCDPTDDNGDGFCDATGSPGEVPTRLSAIDLTPACTNPF